MRNGYNVKRSQWAPYVHLTYFPSPPQGQVVGGIYFWNGIKYEYRSEFRQEEVLATNWEIAA